MVQTIHRNEDGEQITEKTVDVDGTEYVFEGAPTETDVDEWEFQGEGEPPAGAVAALAAHLGDDQEDDVDEDVVDQDDVDEE